MKRCSDQVAGIQSLSRPSVGMFMSCLHFYWWISAAGSRPPTVALGSARAGRSVSLRAVSTTDPVVLPSQTFADIAQEYYETVKQEDAYVAVEKNAAGSRPKELFEDVLEGVEEKFEKDRTVLKVCAGPPARYLIRDGVCMLRSASSARGCSARCSALQKNWCVQMSGRWPSRS